MSTTSTTAPTGRDDGEDTAWQAFVAAARAMCELGGAGLGVVHRSETSRGAEVVVESVAGGAVAPPAASIIASLGESREPASVVDSEGASEPWGVVGWGAARALAIERTEAGRRVERWARAEVARFRDLARAEAAVDAVGEGVVIVDGDGRVAQCTRRAAEILGYEDPVAVEGHAARTIMPRAVDRLEPNEVARGTLDRERRVTYVAHHPAPALGQAAPRSGLVLRLRSETRFAETRKGQLQLLSALRHDVRSPLTALRGLVGVLLDEPDMPREERMPLVELLRQEAERTVTWVEDYLILLRLRFEPRPNNPATIDLAAVLATIERLYGAHARERGVDFTVAQRVETAGPIIGEPPLVDAFCKNLVGHFLRMADSGATVAVRVGAEGSLVIEGHGPGLFAQHPGNPFTTLARSTAAGKRTPGVGLGLFLVKKVADVHGWPITIDSNDGIVRATVRWTEPET